MRPDIGKKNPEDIKDSYIEDSQCLLSFLEWIS